MRFSRPLASRLREVIASTSRNQLQISETSKSESFAALHAKHDSIADLDLSPSPNQDAAGASTWSSSRRDSIARLHSPVSESHEKRP